MAYLTIDTFIGKLTIAEKDGFITNLFFDGEIQEQAVQEKKEAPVLNMAAEQLKEYFQGSRKVFDLPLKPKGGGFYQRVWDIMQHNVPYGSTISYSKLAELAGNIKAARAVGMANNKNPIPIIIPCHRILGKNGNMTGFRAGIDTKKKLLEFEKNNCK